MNRQPTKLGWEGINSQQANEKRFVLINDQRNAKENNEITFFTYHNGTDRREQCPE